MKLSNKMKTELKTRLTSAIAILAVLVLVFACSKNLFVGRSNNVDVAGVVNSDSQAASSSADIIKDSTGIHVKVNANESDGVRRIEVLQDDVSVGVYNYAGTSSQTTEDVHVSIPFNSSRNIKVKVNGLLITDENVQNLRCISTAADLVTFKNLVNAGDAYTGKYVEVTNDIDLTSVCSSSAGSWTPIAAFNGTFNGNFHRIKKLYINTTIQHAGLFSDTNDNAVVENVLLEDVNIYSSYSGATSEASGIVAVNFGVITNCAVLSGSITGYKTGAGNVYAGGIVGRTHHKVYNCYNNASVKAINTATSTATNVGGITGGMHWQYRNEPTIEIGNCYNSGSVRAEYKSTTYIGGLVGEMSNYGQMTTIFNSYNVGNVTWSGSGSLYLGGVVGSNGQSSSWAAGTVSNCYCISSTVINGKSYNYWTGSANAQTTTGCVTDTAMKGLAGTLDAKNWLTDTYVVNSGYPILRWQVPSIELNVNQKYMHVGDTFQLTADTSGNLVALGSITWASVDSSVATVDSTGTVTAVGDGYTTVYATESKFGIRSMAIINVAKQGAVAYAQVDTGEYTSVSATTIVLKEDGTVWAYGDNTYGQLGDGSNVSKSEPVQVKINQNTPLTNIVKISAGAYHGIALSSDGYVYTWGRNNVGQLGVNSSDATNYAVKVLDISGSGYLCGIVDISSGANWNMALGSDSSVYAWGENSNGQVGVNTTDNKLIPKVTITTGAISVAAGLAEGSLLNHVGTIYSWGYGGEGRLATGNSNNSYLPIATNSIDYAEIQRSHAKIVAKTLTGAVYAAGVNNYGEFVNGSTGNAYNVLTQITLPSVVSSTNKVKGIASTSRNIAIVLDDGTIWTSGNNTMGQLSNGGSESSSTSFVKALKADRTPIADAKYISSTQTALGDGAFQNFDYISNDGYVYGVGDNTKGQLGNGTTTLSRYYTKAGIPYLNYRSDDVVIGVGGSKTLSSSNFAVEEFNVAIDYDGTTPGTLTYSTEDSNITVGNNGKIVGVQEGYARVKVKDTTNNLETYVLVKVVNDDNEQVEMGTKFSVALRTNGEVWTWGSNTFGELGTNSNVAYVDEPKQVNDLQNIVDIGAGNYHAVALDGNGYVYTWGLNSGGQLGDGGTIESKVPKKVDGLENIVKVDAYKNITTALDSNGNLYVWGEGYNKTPTIEFTNVRDYKGNAILTKDRKVKRFNGVLISGLRNVIRLDANEDIIIAVKDTGAVVKVDSTNLATDLSVANAVDVSYGNGFGYILTKGCEVYSFGTNAKGQLGNGTKTNIAAASAVKLSATNVEVISAGEGEHGAYATFDGSIYTTGSGDKGQLGHKNIDDKDLFEIVLNVAIESNVDMVVEGIGESTVVDIGLGITLNLKKDLKENSTSDISIVDDTIASLTKNGDGTYTVTGLSYGRTFLNATITGNINGVNQQFATNVEVRIVPEGGITVPQVKSGKDFTVALKANGKMEAWGGNSNGQLGIGNKVNYDEPQELAELDETIVEIAVGDSHVLALTENGTIYGWGLNDVGQVGNGTLADQVSQATVINLQGNELSKIIRVEAHGNHSFAINEDGEVFAWGAEFGSRAVKIVGAVNAVDVSTSYYVKADGTVYDMTNFEYVEMVGKVRAMDEGTDHTVFLTTSGIAYSIGNNQFGQLGTGNTAPIEGGRSCCTS